MTNPNDGRFVWHELLTTDAALATKFYEGLLGWTVREVDMGPGGVYRLLLAGDRQVGGMMTAPPGDPSGWFVYVGADDLDRTAAHIKELGGEVLLGPTTVPGMVRFAVARDPQGAYFAVLKGLGPDADKPMPEGPPAPGTFCWDELHTTNQAAAGKFYGALFGWTGKVGENDPMKYWHWVHAGKDIGGMMDLMSPHAPPHWLAYVAVADVDAATARAKELGGKALMDPMEIEKVGKFSIVQDPTGATFALFRSARV